MKPRRLAPVLLLALASFSLAHAQYRKSDLGTYANLALQAVTDWLKSEGVSVEELRIELVGPPVVPGDHASFHRPLESVHLVGSVRVDQQLRPARISVSVSGPAGGKTASAVTDSESGFEIDGLPAGRFHIRVEASAGPPVEKELQLSAGVYKVLAELPADEKWRTIKAENIRTEGETLRPFALVAVHGGWLKAAADWDLPFWMRAVTYHHVEFEGTQSRIMPREFYFHRDAVKQPPQDEREFEKKLGYDLDFTTSERRQVTRELTAFYDTWVDLARGQERLAPFLADEVECDIFESGARKSISVDCRSFALAGLEALAIQAWLSVESAPYHEDYFWAKKEDISRVAKNIARIRTYFRKADMFTPKHQALLRPYLGRHLGEGRVLKVPPFLWLNFFDEDEAPREEVRELLLKKEREGLKEEETSRLKILLPAGSAYAVVVNDTPLFLFFTRKGGSLRLVRILSSSS